MERLRCPICNKTILETLKIQPDPVLAKGATCSNEYGIHIGFVFYKFIGVVEEALRPQSALIAQ